MDGGCSVSIQPALDLEEADDVVYACSLAGIHQDEVRLDGEMRKEALENHRLVGEVLERLSPLRQQAMRPFGGSKASLSGLGQVGEVRRPVERLGLDLDQPQGVAALLQDVHARQSAVPEERRLEQRDLFLRELRARLLESALRIPVVFQLNALGVLFLGERLHHVPTLRQHAHVRIVVARVGIAVLAEEQLGLAGEGEGEIGLRQRPRAGRAFRGFSRAHA